MKSENEITAIRTSEVEAIKHHIYEVRGLRVMLDRDLAELYGVETKVLNQAVKRNIERFHKDFMFQLDRKDVFFLKSQQVSANEYNADLRSQFVTSSTENTDTDNKTHSKSQIATSNWGGGRYLPYAFTELGIAMLSSVLRSETAIQVNINIMRAFVAIRQAVSAWQGVNLKVEQLSHKVDQLNNYVEEILHDQNDVNRMHEETNTEISLQIEAINDALDQLREKSSTPRKRIGYKTGKPND